MLPLPVLDKKSFREIFEEGRSQIPSLNKEWTDFNYHDPGITMIQLFAWLFEMQHYYADAIGEVHILKYLKLLGYVPHKEEPSKVLVSMQSYGEDRLLPKGIKVAAHDIIFELDEENLIRDNEIVCIIRGEKEIDLTDRVKSHEQDYDYIFTEQDHIFYIGFKNVLEFKDNFLLYIELFEKGRQRKSFEGKSFVLVECIFEAYTKSGWEELTLVEDETVGFLKSGFVHLKGEVKTQEKCLHEQYGKRHYIRCKLVQGTYDVLPKIQKILFNTFKAQQKDTQIVSLYLDGTGAAYQEYPLRHYLAVTGLIEVAVKTQEEDWKICSPRSYRIEERAFLNKTLIFESEQGYLPCKGKDNIRVICYTEEVLKRRIIGPLQGYSNENVTLDFKDMYTEMLELSLAYTKEEGLYLTDFRQTKSLQGENAKARAYECLEGDKLLFGDGTQGCQVDKKYHEIYLTQLIYTKGENGNVKVGQIKTFLPPVKEILKDVAVTNYRHSQGGRNKESIEEAIQHFREAFQKKQRALTDKDYEEIVKDTPGLFIDKVKTLSYSELKGEQIMNNKVYIIVKPYIECEKMPTLSTAYKEAIAAHVDKYRLLTTEIIIQSPIYLAIDVYGCIYKQAGYKQERIEELIKKEVDSVEGNKDFGKTIVFGTLFGRLESLQGVRHIENLSLEPRGQGGIKNLAGDIIVKPNVLTYVRHCQIELR